MQPDFDDDDVIDIKDERRSEFNQGWQPDVLMHGIDGKAQFFVVNYAAQIM